MDTNSFHNEITKWKCVAWLLDSLSHLSRVSCVWIQFVFVFGCVINADQMRPTDAHHHHFTSLGSVSGLFKWTLFSSIFYVCVSMCCSTVFHIHTVSQFSTDFWYVLPSRTRISVCVCMWVSVQPIYSIPIIVGTLEDCKHPTHTIPSRTPPNHYQSIQLSPSLSHTHTHSFTLTLTQFILLPSNPLSTNWLFHIF